MRVRVCACVCGVCVCVPSKNLTFFGLSRHSGALSRPGSSLFHQVWHGLELRCHGVLAFLKTNLYVCRMQRMAHMYNYTYSDKSTVVPECYCKA